MPLYIVKADKFDYDQYNEMLVYAISKDDAEKIAIEHNVRTAPFPNDKQKWTAEKIEIHELEYGVILASFNAG